MQHNEPELRSSDLMLCVYSTFDLGNSGFNTSETFSFCLESLQIMWMSAKQSLRPPHHEAEDHCGEETADETLPGLLWGELQENEEKKKKGGITFEQ